jgi:hypothetical protein
LLDGVDASLVIALLSLHSANAKFISIFFATALQSRLLPLALNDGVL